jgi:hypothetical protein
MIVEDIVHGGEEKDPLRPRKPSLGEGDGLRQELFLRRERCRDLPLDIGRTGEVPGRHIVADDLSERLTLGVGQDVGTQEGRHHGVRLGDDRLPPFLMACERLGQREGEQQRDHADEPRDRAPVQLFAVVRPAVPATKLS